MSAQPEVWRVSTDEGIFETDFETLKQWIAEGCVLPTDKVSKGNLSWIEAGRVPKLKSAFDPAAAPAPKQAAPSFEEFVETTMPPTRVEPARAQDSPPPTTAGCHNHPEANPEYVCRMCGAAFCKDCPKFVSQRVPVCPLCGDLCRVYREVTERVARAEFQSSGFGMEDFVRAIRYPLQHKSALFGGALIYAVVLLAGFRGALVAWMIMFGCISHVISQVAWGRLNRSFMPDFSAFSLWDDLVVPLFLGIGITIVTWGPLIVLMFALIFGVVSSRMQASPLHDANQPVESSGPDVKVLLDPNADPAKLEAENKKLNGLRPGAQIAREAEQSKDETNDPTGTLKYLLPYLGSGIALALLLLLLIGWALFYYPMALTVAGYTQSLGSVLNPLVGLDTIRRMGVTYFKGFGMVILVQLAALVVGVIVSIVTSPLTLPYIGNLLANFINATFTFYFNLVIACILGLSLFKCADRLGIAVD